MNDQREVTGEQIAHWTEQISKLRLAGYSTPAGEERHYIDLHNTLTLLPAIVSEAFYAGAAYGLSIKPAVIEVKLTEAQLAEIRKPRCTCDLIDVSTHPGKPEFMRGRKDPKCAVHAKPEPYQHDSGLANLTVTPCENGLPGIAITLAGEHTETLTMSPNAAQALANAIVAASNWRRP